ncbi:MAG: methyltransferase domain-containing protein [Desulfopila sp.]
MLRQRPHLPLLVLVLICIAVAGTVAISRLDIDTDITTSLPAHDPVVADALDIFRHHPFQDQVAIDIMVDRKAPDILVSCATLLEEKMRESGLFGEIGLGDVAQRIPEVARQVAGSLPLLFSAGELEQQVAPRLLPDRVNSRLQQLIAEMSSLEGIGQSAYIATDPLGLKDLVLARLIHLAPSHNGRIYKGNLISADDRHLLFIARPATAGANTEAARKLVDFFAEAATELSDAFASSGVKVTLTPTGTYRAALDNETIIRHDVQLALGLSTAGIALLLFLAFPRPLISLLSLIPPLVGITMALFVYSLYHSSISIMVLGFAGALISVMDDYSIAYLLFLDRPRATNSKRAAFEVRSIGGPIALATTIVSFLILSRADFPIFTALGEFTALGLAFTYLFIYLVCPRLFPGLSPSPRRNPPLHRFSTMLFSGGRPGLVVAGCLAAVLLVFARPQFHLSLGDMNTMSAATQAANRLFTEVWGSIDGKVLLMSKSDNRQELQRHNDRLLERLDRDMARGDLQSAFNPSMIFPGQELARHNLAAWHSFWSRERVERLSGQLEKAGERLGFARDAFRPFLAMLAPDFTLAPTVPAASYDRLLGISSQESAGLIQFTAITIGRGYDAQAFLADYGQDNTVFDGTTFSDRLAEILFSTFTSSLLIMFPVISLMVFLYFLDWQLTVLTLSPLVFAFVCTLGTLNLFGHPLDIPGLMLTVVILGLGIDYTIYTVCGRQRYGAPDHESYVLVRSAVVLSAASTLIGFGVLCLAEHATLKSVGITSLCGIGYSFIGNVLILPPLLEKVFAHRRGQTKTSLPAAIAARYRHLEAYPRVFARCKLAIDPLFTELAGILDKTDTAPNRILDIGCGYGAPACWCLERFSNCRVVGIDPDAERVRVAGRAVADRGVIMEGGAPDLPLDQGTFDVLMLLDMLHYLDNRQLADTMVRAATLLQAQTGRLVARFVVRPRQRRRSLHWFLEDLRSRRRLGIAPTYHLPEELITTMNRCGFHDVRVVPASDPELFWLIARR